MAMPSKFRSAMITSFVMDGFMDRDNADPAIKYAVWQVEKCPTTDRLHYQAYVEFKKPMSMRATKVIFGNHVHVEPRRGTPTEARMYCMKEETRVEDPVEYGEWTEAKQGRRSDLEAACAIVKEHGVKRVAEEMPAVYVRSFRGLQQLEMVLKGKRDWVMEVHVYWGDSGSGKSRKAFEENPDAYFKDGNNEWWDGYDGQECVILDDFYGGIRFNYMQRLLDRYPMQVQTKGGHVQFVSKKIIMTSNKPWEEWYSLFSDPRNEQLKASFARRLTSVTHFTLPPATQPVAPIFM